MSKEKHQSATPATDWLKQHKVAFEPFSYEYVEHGGTASVAAAFGLDHHTVVKTLIMEDEHAKPRCRMIGRRRGGKHGKKADDGGGKAYEMGDGVLPLLRWRCMHRQRYVL